MNITQPTVIEALLPNVRDFKILYKGDKVPIGGFLKILIQFCDRIQYVSGLRNVINVPLITYYVQLNDESKKVIYNKTPYSYSNNLCLTKQSCRVLLGEKEYSFKGFISYIPRALNSSTISGSVLKEDVVVEIDFGKVESELQNRTMEEFYKEYQSRYEIMEIG